MTSEAVLRPLVARSEQLLEALRNVLQGHIVVALGLVNGRVRIVYDSSHDLAKKLASEANKSIVKGNKHMDTRMIKVSGFKSEVKSELRGCLEAAKPLKPP